MATAPPFLSHHIYNKNRLTKWRLGALPRYVAHRKDIEEGLLIVKGKQLWHHFHRELMVGKWFLKFHYF